MKELRGHDSWYQWHKDMLVQLDVMGLRHLLRAGDLQPLSAAAQHQFAADQQRAVQLLVAHTSTPVLQQLWDRGWEVRGATLNNTLALLADLLAEPARHPPQSYETHRDIVDLARADLARGSSLRGLDQFLADAQQCHLRLLARYGGGGGSVEELLEHLFTSSVMEGLRAAQPAEHAAWMQALDRGTQTRFLKQLVAFVKDPPRRDGRAQEDAAAREREERKAWEKRRERRPAKRSRAAWRLPPYVPPRKRYRGTDYPDCYQPRYDDDDSAEVEVHERSYTAD